VPGAAWAGVARCPALLFASRAACPLASRPITWPPCHRLLPQLLTSQLQEVRAEVGRLQEEARGAAQLQEAAAADVAKVRAELGAAQEQARLHYARAEGLAAQLRGKDQAAGALQAQLSAVHQEADSRKRQADEEAERCAGGGAGAVAPPWCC
jgi:hypothetical protein